MVNQSKVKIEFIHIVTFRLPWFKLLFSPTCASHLKFDSNGLGVKFMGSSTSCIGNSQLSHGSAVPSVITASVCQCSWRMNSDLASRHRNRGLPTKNRNGWDEPEHFGAKKGARRRKS